MADSVIVFGGNKKFRQISILSHISETIGTEISDIKKLQNNPDILIIDAEDGKRSISIIQSRQIIRFLSEKPFSHNYKYVVIFNGDKMTTEAQNALLKTLEEPPTYASLIIETKTVKDLLDTIVSRCKRYDASLKHYADSDVPAVSTSNNFISIYELDIGNRLQWIDSIDLEDREGIADMLEQWVLEIRKLIKTKSITPNHGAIVMSKLEDFKKDIQNTNVSIKFGLENLLISI